MTMNVRPDRHELLSDRVLGRRAIALVSAIAFLLAAAAIHAAQIKVHLEEWNVAGLFFIASTIVQLSLAVALARTGNWRARDLQGLLRSFSALPPRNVVVTVVATSFGLVTVWAISRTLGIPFGPNEGATEPLNRPDALATMFELLTVIAMFPLLRATSTRRTSWTPRRAHSVIVGALLLSTIGTTAAALQPVTCATAAGGENEPTGKEEANQALIDALLNHGRQPLHSGDDDGHEEQKDTDSHDATESSGDDCH